VSPARKEELLARDTTVSAKAEELRKEVETLNREQQVIISRDKEVHTIEKVYPYVTTLLYIYIYIYINQHPSGALMQNLFLIRLRICRKILN
jgi:hypothetical protein